MRINHWDTFIEWTELPAVCGYTQAHTRIRTLNLFLVVFNLCVHIFFDYMIIMFVLFMIISILATIWIQISNMLVILRIVPSCEFIHEETVRHKWYDINSRQINSVSRTSRWQMTDLSSSFNWVLVTVFLLYAKRILRKVWKIAINSDVSKTNEEIGKTTAQDEKTVIK